MTIYLEVKKVGNMVATLTQSSMDAKQQSAGLGKYTELAFAAGIGATLASGILVGLSSTITVWQKGLSLSTAQVGIISAVMSFAIALGSLAGGRVADKVGRVHFFNWISALYVVGAFMCAAAMNFGMLTVGIIVAGVASGAEIPVAITVLSYDAPNSAMGSKLVSTSQIFWQIGIFVSYIAAFLVSSLSGAMGGRIVFGFFAGMGIVVWGWRVFSSGLKRIHAEADERHNIQARAEEGYDTQKVSVFSVLLGSQKKALLGFLGAITGYYVMWNLLANTWGQFQTYMFSQAGANQTLATALGIGLNLITLILNIVFAAVSGGKYRNSAFYAGLILTLFSIIVMALGGASLGVIITATALLYAGIPLAGEAMYKVWTQESFPISIRATVQGFINGFSRLIYGLFALVTPMLVAPSVIKSTMWGFVGVVIIEAVAGFTMIVLQKKYGTDEHPLNR
ncbi:MFS transporter [Alloscardovia venturai]